MCLLWTLNRFHKLFRFHYANSKFWSWRNKYVTGTLFCWSWRKIMTGYTWINNFVQVILVSNKSNQTLFDENLKIPKQLSVYRISNWSQKWNAHQWTGFLWKNWKHFFPPETGSKSSSLNQKVGIFTAISELQTMMTLKLGAEA